MGTPMEGFFDGADIMVEPIASTPTAAQGVPAEAPIPSHKLGPIEESAQTERVGESASIPAKIPTPQKGVTSVGASQIRSASLATPLVISASDPFVALSQAVKDGSSLVVTPSSIPSFAMGPMQIYHLMRDLRRSLRILRMSPLRRRGFLILMMMVLVSTRLRPWVCVFCPCLSFSSPLFLAFLLIAFLCNSLIILYIHSFSQRYS